MMKLLYSIIFLFTTNILLSQDTLKNNFPNYFITTIEIKYDLIEIKNLRLFSKNHNYFSSLDLHKTINPFAVNELPPYFDLKLFQEDIFEFQSGFEIEGMDFYFEAKNNYLNPTSKNHYTKSSLIYTTNFDEKESVNFYQQLTKKPLSMEIPIWPFRI